MKKYLNITISVVFLLVLVSCYNDKEELLYPGGSSCDTTSTPSYTKTILPIFQQYCLSCHNSNSPSGGIVMGTYTADKAIALNGKLMGSITHKSGYSPMPQGMPKLSSCQIAKISKWVTAGIPNN